MSSVSSRGGLLADDDEQTKVCMYDTGFVWRFLLHVQTVHTLPCKAWLTPPSGRSHPHPRPPNSERRRVVPLPSGRSPLPIPAPLRRRGTRCPQLESPVCESEVDVCYFIKPPSCFQFTPTIDRSNTIIMSAHVFAAVALRHADLLVARLAVSLPRAAAEGHVGEIDCDGGPRKDRITINHVRRCIVG